MIIYGSTQWHFYSFEESGGAHNGYPIRHYELVKKWEDQREFFAPVKCELIEGVVSCIEQCTVQFDQPVRIVDFTSILPKPVRTQELAAGWHKFDVLRVTIPPKPLPPLYGEICCANDPKTEQVIKILRSSSGRPPKPKQIDLAVLHGTVRGMALAGLWTHQERQSRRRAIDEAERGIVSVLRTRLRQLEHLEEFAATGMVSIFPLKR